MVTYVPDRGDFIWLGFDPQAGHEQAGRRPALVISPKSYNQLTGLCLVVPVTNQSKGYKFEVGIINSPRVSGVILSDHVKSFDWKARNAEFISKAHRPLLEEAIAKLRTLID